MSVAVERHFSVPEIAKLWHYAPCTIRKFFSNEPGVIRIGNPDRPRKRKGKYFTLAIPESVVNRVHARLEKQQVAR